VLRNAKFNHIIALNVCKWFIKPGVFLLFADSSFGRLLYLLLSFTCVYPMMA
jgi:hypothetical protein